MENTEKPQVSSTSAQWSHAKGKRDTYLSITVVMLALVVIGVVSGVVLDKPEAGWLPWLPVNFGTYGIAGISAFYLIIMIVITIATFISCIRNTGLGLIVSAIISILVFGVGFTLFEKVVVWLYNLINTNFVFSFFGITFNGAVEIPVSGTLGAALFNTVLFTLPFIFCVVKLVLYARKASSLKKM